jgi:hypothetical protein
MLPICSVASVLIASRSFRWFQLLLISRKNQKNHAALPDCLELPDS